MGVGRSAVSFPSGSSQWLPKECLLDVVGRKVGGEVLYDCWGCVKEEVEAAAGDSLQ